MIDKIYVTLNALYVQHRVYRNRVNYDKENNQEQIRNKIVLWYVSRPIAVPCAGISRYGPLQAQRSSLTFTSPCPHGALQPYQYLLEGKCSRAEATQEVPGIDENFLPMR